jgi:hypothetical protein
MTQSTDTSKHEITKLENTTYNILAALGREADFLYSTIDTTIMMLRRPIDRTW